VKRRTASGVVGYACHDVVRIRYQILGFEYRVDGRLNLSRLALNVELVVGSNQTGVEAAARRRSQNRSKGGSEH